MLKLVERNRELEEKIKTGFHNFHNYMKNDPLTPSGGQWISPASRIM